MSELDKAIPDKNKIKLLFLNILIDSMILYERPFDALEDFKNKVDQL